MPVKNDLSRSRLADTYGALDMERRQPTEAELYGPANAQPVAPAAPRRALLYGNRAHPEQEKIDCTVPAHLMARWRRIGERLRVLRDSTSRSDSVERLRASDIQFAALNAVKQEAQEAVVDAWARQIAVLEADLRLE